MNGRSRKDRLSPPLMFAFRSAFAARDSKKRMDLRDEAGERVLASRRLANRTAITEPLLRKEVALDLEALLNTIALESAEDLAGFDHVRRSILNHGLPDLARRTADEAGTDELKDELEAVLKTYEPRLASETVQATRAEADESNDLKVRFVVQADLRCEPVDVPVEFVADVEVDSAAVQVNRL